MKLKRKKAKAPKAPAVASYQMPRREPLIDRHDVEAAYRHPSPSAPLQAARRAPRPLAIAAELAGYRVRCLDWTGTTAPTWREVLPTSGGPPVAAEHYRGDQAEGYAILGKHERLGSFRASWVDGRIGSVLLRPPGGSWQVIGITALTALVKSGDMLATPPRKATP